MNALKKRLSSYNLTLKLSLSIGGMLLALFVVVAAIFGYVWFTDLTENLEHAGVTVAEEAAANINNVFAQSEQAALLLAKTLEQKKLSREEVVQEIEMMTRSINKNTPELIGVCVAYHPYKLDKNEKYNALLGFIDAKGNYRFNVFGDDHVQYFHRDWYMVPVTLRRPVWCVPFYSEGGINTMLLSYAVPFYLRNEKGEKEIGGAVVIDIKIDLFRKYLENAKINEYSKTFLMNQFGLIVIHPDPELELVHSIFSLGYENFDPVDRYKTLSVFRAAHKSGVVDFSKVPLLGKGGSQLFFARCLNDWIVGISIPSDWIVRQIMPRFWNFLFAWLCFMALVEIVILAVTRKINKPLSTLSKAAEAVGKGDFNAKLPELDTQDEIGKLSRSFLQMQSELDRYVADVKRNVAMRERMEGELSVARSIQNDLLPAKLPPFDNCPDVAMAAKLIPARTIGGDLYDSFVIDDEHLAITIGDVSGKGVPAALFMAVTQTMLRSLTVLEKSPEKLIFQLNNQLTAHNDSVMFVTYFLAIVNFRTGETVCTNAGHNPVLLIRSSSGDISELRSVHGPALGVVADQQYGSSRVTLESGDRLVLYTDGVTEAFNAAGEMFGMARLIQAAATAEPDAAPEALLRHILDRLKTFVGGAEQSDDITLSILEFKQRTVEQK